MCCTIKDNSLSLGVCVCTCLSDVGEGGGLRYFDDCWDVMAVTVIAGQEGLHV